MGENPVELVCRIWIDAYSVPRLGREGVKRSFCLADSGPSVASSVIAGAAKSLVFPVGGSGSLLQRWWVAGVSLVAVHGEAVDAEGVGDQVEVLSVGGRWSGLGGARGCRRGPG